MDETRSGSAWLLYVVRCRDGTLYCGITTDLERRLAAHAAGRGARYTRGRGPLTLLRAWPATDESAARVAEAAFKRLSRRQKLRAIDSAATTVDERSPEATHTGAAPPASLDQPAALF